MSSSSPAPWQKVLSEFVASALFLFCVSASTVVPRLVRAEDSVALLITALVQGLSLVAVIACFSWVSGSHVNMAVTTTAILTNKMGPRLGLSYMAAQLSGSFVGAGLARACFPNWQSTHLSAPALGQGVRLYQAYVIETVLTFLLLLAVLGTSTDARGGLYLLAPIPIGFTLLIGVLLAGPLTGASLSPNRALATAVVGDFYDHQWIYWVAPLSAVGFATGMYYLIFEVRNDQPTAASEIPLVAPGTRNTFSVA
jgi:glycerol uptake facilitator-like aquaporin